MPKIVEIIGPSGSGKSSVYKGLKESWKYGYNWVTFDQVNYSSEVQLGKIFKKGQRFFKNIIPRKKTDISKPAIIDQWKFAGSNNDYFLGKENEKFKSVLMDLIGEHCKTGFSGDDKRFITAYMAMWSMARIDTVKSIANDDRYCILDQGEGLISRIMHLTTPSFDEESLNLFLEHVPYPDVLFYLKTDLDVIVERVIKRNRSSSLHEGMNESEIVQYTKKTNNFLRIAADILDNKNVEVHKIDSSQTIDQIVREITQVLSSKPG